jgi:TRAP transporter TAXI family solute receptor
MTIRIGTAENHSTFFSQGLALKTVLERQASLRPVEVMVSGHASIENARRLQAGDMDFGFMASNWIGRARGGEPPFTGPIELRMAAPMNAGPLFFIARADSGLRTVSDLRGRRVVFGGRSSGMAQHAQVILNALGIGADAIEPVFLDFGDGADALASGAVDAQLQCPIPNKVMTALTRHTAVRVLSYAPDQLAAVLAAVPYYRPTTMRKGALPGLDADLPQLAVVNVLVTHARTGAGTVREAVRAIVEAADELPLLNPLFGEMAALFEPLRRDGAAALEFGGVPLHDGARAAYREVGLLLV